ncbi:MAG: hypothetical protein F6K19_39130 [Cyanothece sp. SIO1E1]|nr:hypothetical protein [Cyanothece sp. SIO1E1]
MKSHLDLLIQEIDQSTVSKGHTASKSSQEAAVSKRAQIEDESYLNLLLQDIQQVIEANHVSQ